MEVLVVSSLSLLYFVKCDASSTSIDTQCETAVYTEGSRTEPAPEVMEARSEPAAEVAEPKADVMSPAGLVSTLPREDKAESIF